MKKTFKIILITVMITAVLTVAAFASSFDHCADALNEMGLFRGTQNGYELDRVPTRAEAATMLVRLLGAEDDALELSYTAPYTDVADWAKPYVQYLHNAGLTKGTSATTFGYSDKCTEQQYATFLLRALGYTDGENGDFTYVDALAFAEECGVVDFVNGAGPEFLRDNVAAMSFTVLSVAPKSGEADLLTKLKASGAVADDKGYIEFFENYRKYTEASKTVNNVTTLSTDIKMNMTSAVDGVENMKMDYALSLAADIDAETPDKSKMKYEGTIKALTDIGEGKMNVEMPVSYYFADGWLYIDVSGQKQKAELSYSDALETMDINMQTDTNPICLIKNIEVKKTADGYETYNVTCAPGGINAIAGLIETEDMADYVLLTMSVKLRGEKLVSMSGDMKMAVAADEKTTDISVAYEMTNIKTGADVKITPPQNLSEYK